MNRNTVLGTLGLGLLLILIGIVSQEEASSFDLIQPNSTPLQLPATEAPSHQKSSDRFDEVWGIRELGN